MSSPFLTGRPDEPIPTLLDYALVIDWMWAFAHNEEKKMSLFDMPPDVRYWFANAIHRAAIYETQQEEEESVDEEQEPEKRTPYTVPWRVGRKLGRTIYAQYGKEARDTDQFIGIMDTPGFAERVVLAHNSLLSERKWNKEGR